MCFGLIFALPPLSPPLLSGAQISKQNVHGTFDPITNLTPVHVRDCTNVIAGADAAADRPGGPVLLLLADAARVGLRGAAAAAGTHRRLRAVRRHDRQARGQGMQRCNYIWDSKFLALNKGHLMSLNNFVPYFPISNSTGCPFWSGQCNNNTGPNQVYCTYAHELNEQFFSFQM